MLKISTKKTARGQITNNMQTELPYLNVQTLDCSTKKFPFMLEVATPVLFLLIYTTTLNFEASFYDFYD